MGGWQEQQYEVAVQRERKSEEQQSERREESLIWSHWPLCEGKKHC